MSFLEKYLIVSKLETSETMSFQAQDTLTGMPVLLHQLLPGRTPPHQPDLAILVFKYLPGAGAPGTEHFLEMGQEDDRVFIVTKDVPECVDLRSWLQSIAVLQGEGGASIPSTPEAAWSESAAQVPEYPLTETVIPQPVAPPEPLEGTHEPGEFTRMFSSSHPAAKPAEKRPRGKIPDGFEVVFQSPQQAPRGVSPVAPERPTITPPPPGRPAETAGPGEFTQVFSRAGKGKAGHPPPPAPPRPPSVAPPQPTPETAGPSEFTQMFSRAGKGTAGHPSPPTASLSVGPPDEPLVQDPAEEAPPGEFTQMFQASGAKTGPHAAPPSSREGTRASAPPPPLPAQPPAAYPDSPSDSPGPGEFTQMFNRGSHPREAAPDRGIPPRPSAPLPGASKKGPGELTQLMQGYKPPAATPAAPALDLPQPASPPPPAEPSKKAPGEFTMLFQHPPTPAAPTPAGAAPPAGAPPAPPPPPAHQPGEYTSLFEVSRPPTPPQGAPQAAPPAGYAYPAVPGAPPPSPPMPPMPAPQAPPPPAAPPVAYPQAAMPKPPQYQPPPPPAYAAPPPPAMPPMQPMPMPPPPAPQAAPAGPKKSGKFLVLLLCLGGLFLIALLLILFFAFKR